MRRWILAGVLLLLALPAGAATPQWLDGPNARATTIQAEVFDTHAEVYQAGPDDAPPVLLVHGLGSNGAQIWRSLIPVLARDHHVIAVDLPGFGASGKPNALYSPDNYAEFLDQVLARFADGPVQVVGHSMGAAIAIYYANLHPQRIERMVLAATAGMLHGSAYATFLAHVGVEEFLPQLPGVAKAAGKLVQRLLAKFESLGPDPEVALASPESRQRYLDGDPTRIAGLALVSTDFSKAIRQVETPTLLMWGTDDQVAPLRVGYLLTGVMPHAALTLVENGGHAFVLEQRSLANDRIAKMLAMDERTFARYTTDQYPLPAQSPRDGRRAECRNESGRVFEGDFERLLIYDCDDIEIRNARVGKLEVISSGVSMRNSHVIGGENALVASSSTMEITAGSLQARVPIHLTGSRLDVAGARVVAQDSLVEASAPSVVTFSVTRVDSPTRSGYLHDLFHVTPDQSL